MSDPIGKQIIAAVIAALFPDPMGTKVFEGGITVPRGVPAYYRVALIKEDPNYPTTKAARSPIADRHLSLLVSSCVQGTPSECEVLRATALARIVAATSFQSLLSEPPCEIETNWTYPAEGQDKPLTCAHTEWQFRYQTLRGDLTRSKET
jgi:hypothetical protein